MNYALPAIFCAVGLNAHVNSFRAVRLYTFARVYLNPQKQRMPDS